MIKVSVTDRDGEFMKEAISLAEQSVDRGGGPFGAVIVKDGQIVASASNSVTLDNDPTGHAEVNCIRKACKALGTFDLTGCVIYTSCEPCPMCLGAIYWAHIDRVFYAGDRKDAAEAGFDDEFIYEEFARDLDSRRTPIIHILPEEGTAPFRRWMLKSDKIEY